MALANVFFAIVQLIVLYQLVTAMGAYISMGSPLRDAFKEARRALSIKYILKVLLILILVPLLISIVDQLLYVYIGDVRLIEIYLRGYNPEALQMINEAVKMGWEVYYAQAPTWLDLLVPILIGRLVGRSLANILNLTQ